MAPKWAPVRVFIVKFLVLHSSDPIRGKQCHRESKMAIIEPKFTKIPLFFLYILNFCLFCFLAMNVTPECLKTKKLSKMLAYSMAGHNIRGAGQLIIS